jgi:hypothetical protein
VHELVRRTMSVREVSEIPLKINGTFLAQALRI